jgi:hypothetical protein
MANWTPLKDVPALAAYLTSPASRAAAPARAAADQPGSARTRSTSRILGSEMQFVEVELDPGESAVAEAGSMMYMTPASDGDRLRRRLAAAQRGVMGRCSAPASGSSPVRACS